MVEGMTTAPQPQTDEMREFLLIVRQALKMIVAWIEKRYCLGDYKAKK
jgi:hypothetical protein